MSKAPAIDPLFSVKVLAQTPAPQALIYAAMHQDYSEGFVGDESLDCSEAHYGELAVKRLLNGNRGHFGPLEHPVIGFAVGYFPHSVMQQGRTHRIGCSWDVQSFRYSGDRLTELSNRIAALEDWPGTADVPQEWHQWVEEVFYLRPAGDYADRQGKRYKYTTEERAKDLEYASRNALHYANKIKAGFSGEHARGQICFDVRQHFVVSFNARSLMHFLDLRAKQDAQLEIQQMCELMLPHFESWMPEVAAWYCKERWGKARLAP